MFTQKSKTATTHLTIFCQAIFAVRQKMEGFQTSGLFAVRFNV